MRTKRYNEWLREGFEFKPDSSGDYRYAGHDLTSLKGAPESVGGNFYCGRNMLMSLEGAPESVGGDFYCSSNSLMTLVGAPEKIVGNFSCDEFIIDRGKWGIEGWLEVLEKGTDKAKSLILTLLSDDLLDKFILDDPMRLHLLDGHPDLKAGVLKRTGVKDLSRLGRTIKTGLL